MQWQRQQKAAAICSSDWTTRPIAAAVVVVVVVVDVVSTVACSCTGTRKLVDEPEMGALHSFITEKRAHSKFIPDQEPHRPNRIGGTASDHEAGPPRPFFRRRVLPVSRKKDLCSLAD